MANQFPATGTITYESNVDLLNKAIEAIWMRRDEHSDPIDSLFETINVQSGNTHVFSSVSSVVGLPQINNDTDPRPYVQPAPGFDQTYTMVQRRSGIRVTDQALRYDRFGKLVAMTNGLVKSAKRVYTYQYASVINGAFASTTTADGVYLCSDSHLQENPEAGTYDNLGSGALAGATLQALRLLGMKMTNDMGYPDPVILKKLLVPPDLEQKANELTRSAKVAEDALNAETQLINNLEISVSPFCSSTTAYFGFGDRVGEEKGLICVELCAPVMKDNNPSDADMKIDKGIKMIFAVGAYSGKNIYGATGA